MIMVRVRMPLGVSGAITRPLGRRLIARQCLRISPSRTLPSTSQRRYITSESPPHEPHLSQKIQVDDYSDTAGPYQPSVKELLAHGAPIDNVIISGWVRSTRYYKRTAFAVISDGSTTKTIQAVMPREQVPQREPVDSTNNEMDKTERQRANDPYQLSRLSHGTAVRMTGQWLASRAKGQPFELLVSSIDILGENDAEKNPLQPKFQTPEFLRTIPHLRWRTPQNSVLLRLRSQVIQSLAQFFTDRGYVQTHPPLITSSDCEGAGEVFTVSANTKHPSESSTAAGSAASPEQSGHFFRSPKYLTVSSQLHLEALAQAVGNVWTLSPTFRAEPSDTPRHLSEFYMLEAEASFICSLPPLLSFVESMLQAVASSLIESDLGHEILSLAPSHEHESSVRETLQHWQLTRRWEALAQGNFHRMTYTQAIAALQSAEQTHPGTKFTHAPTWTDGLHAEHERWLVEVYHAEETSSILDNADTGRIQRPLFITDYPAEQKPFYMAPSTSSDPAAPGKTVACFDLIIPGHLELAGGSLREHRHAELLAAMHAKGMNVGGNDAGNTSAGDVEPQNPLQWYLDLRKFGSAPHGGFGLGFDRLLAYLSGRESVRDVVLWPRWKGRCEG